MTGTVHTLAESGSRSRSGHPQAATRKRRLLLADLYASPLTRFGQDAVQRLFTETQTTAMLTFLNSLAVGE